MSQSNYKDFEVRSSMLSVDQVKPMSGVCGDQNTKVDVVYQPVFLLVYESATKYPGSSY